MRNPKVSIIIAAYNAGPTIEKALCSVEKQSFQDWECLIIDGMSQDDTIQKVKYFADKDNRFRVFSEPDKGVFDAFNKGWQKAQGEWIYYLGSDDELLPDGIKSLMEYADGVDLVYGGIRMKYRSK
ncbi:glycosyltransferase, partial [Phocaeicola vulgatus]